MDMLSFTTSVVFENISIDIFPYVDTSRPFISMNGFLLVTFPWSRIREGGNAGQPARTGNPLNGTFGEVPCGVFKSQSFRSLVFGTAVPFPKPKIGNRKVACIGSRIWKRCGIFFRWEN
jgi:hypothetical protein